MIPSKEFYGHSVQISEYYVYTSMRVCMFVCMCVFIYLCICILLCADMSVYICMHVCFCVYTRTYTFSITKVPGKSKEFLKYMHTCIVQLGYGRHLLVCAFTRLSPLTIQTYARRIKTHMHRHTQTNADSQTTAW
jgi:hypothetical protein